MSIHLNLGSGKVACNYNRWKGGSMDLTSNKDRNAVTCKRCWRVMLARFL